jgi:hypothetical protein
MGLKCTKLDGCGTNFGQSEARSLDSQPFPSLQTKKSIMKMLQAYGSDLACHGTAHFVNCY